MKRQDICPPKKRRFELDLFQSLICLQRCKTCVEIGAGRGRGLSFLLEAVKSVEGHIISFDRRLSRINTIVDKFNAAGIDSSLYDMHCLNTRKERGKFEHILDLVYPTGIDFAFIDGDHSYLGIKNDFEVIYPRLSKTGIIAFDDTLCSDGCREFMLDLRTKYSDKTFDIVEFPFAGAPPAYIGVTVLIKKTFANSDVAISHIHGSLSTPEDIELKESEQYKAESTAHKNYTKALSTINAQIEYCISDEPYCLIVERKKFEKTRPESGRMLHG